MKITYFAISKTSAIWSPYIKPWVMELESVEFEFQKKVVEKNR